MKAIIYLLPLVFALPAVSCKNKSASAKNPYASNPYYGPSASTGNTTRPYATTGAASYPTYSDSTYTPPSTTVPSVPSVPTYSAPVPSTPSAPVYSAPANSAPAYAGGSAASRTHTVASGDNLYRISQRYGTSVNAIKSANGLNSDTIHPGQVLQIPS